MAGVVLTSPSRSWKGFQTWVLRLYENRGRDFFWRRQTDPYTVLVSEFMLQQTQTERVEQRLPSFIEKFPNFAALAAAPVGQLVQEWLGLGYNRRALSLHRSAQIIVSEYGGELPEDPNSLIRLPGVGPYTSRAVACFAFNSPEVFIETNIRRVFLHHFFDSNLTGVSDRQIFPLIEESLDRKNPRRWYYALMDYGAALKRLVGNANLRSAAYVRQSTFAGSFRQLRGAILRQVGADSVGEGQLRYALRKEGAMEVDSSRLRRALEALSADGFLRRETKDGEVWWSMRK